MHFDWTVRTIKEWNNFYSKAISANWMQTWAYAQASFKSDYLTSKMALIIENQMPIGMMCIQQVKMGPVRIINLKRGPLWFREVSADMLVEFAKAFRLEFPKSLFQRLRWMPEFDFKDDQTAILAMQKIGFKLRKEEFLTSWLDLSLSEAELRKQLNQKWRNCLNKSEKQQIFVKAEESLGNLHLFFKYYLSHLQFKKYKGPSVKFLNEEFQELSKSSNIQLFWALEGKKPIAGLCLAFHGNSASYRLGWNTLLGRKKNSHYLLLWSAILLAKSKGYSLFDLGGLLPDDAPGITHFKMGLRGKVTKSLTLS